MKLDYEFAVIGSGFGGAVSAARLSKRWERGGILLERGKEFPLGGFARSPADLADNFWAPADDASHTRHVKRRRALRGALLGLFDVRTFDHMDTVTAAGLGGGSLIYANVFLRPPEAVFQNGLWPQHLNPSTLAAYYDVGQAVLAARPTPPAASTSDRRYIRRTQVFEDFAKEAGLTAKKADIAVFFGKGYAQDPATQATDMGVQEQNRYGALQTSCTYCGECDIGCNMRAKNTTDLNYIHAARTRYGLEVRSLAQVTRIVPLDDGGRDDPAASGTYGYRIYVDDLANGSAFSLTAQRVVVSAGTLGSNELLLRCRDHFKTLPRISDQLGQRFSGNGDFLSFALDGEQRVGSTHGPVITQYTDHHLFAEHDPARAFLLEDASIPAHAGWAMAALEPVMTPIAVLRRLLGVVVDVLRRRFPGWAAHRLGFLASKLMAHDMVEHSAVLLCMGLDRSDGRFSLTPAGGLNLDWPQNTSASLYASILSLGERFRRYIGAKWFIPLPTWKLGHNVTVHPLGGCRLADSPETGVVSAADGSRGQVFGYEGLYVADGSIVPGALGANPAATITALTEWICHDMTGSMPDASL
ncbi:MAG: GMC family oxidoreductase [Burkholderiales bacterium]|nr:GMC family oxidoreductase [Burkholderiales bacterium]